MAAIFLICIARSNAQVVPNRPLQQSASLSGHITDQLGAPLQANVMVYGRAVVDGRVDLFAMCSTATDKDGFYTCKALRAGQYVVSALGVPRSDTDTKRAILTYPRTFAPSATILANAEIVSLVSGDYGSADVVVHAVAPASLNGKLADRPASPSFLVRSHFGSFELPVEAQAAYDAQSGRFHIEALPPGELKIYADWWGASSMQHYAGSVVVEAGQSVTAQLEPVARHVLSGSMILPKEASASSTLPRSVTLLGTGDRLGWRFDAPVDTNGLFASPPLEYGSYLLETPPDSGLYVADVNNREGNLLVLAPSSFKGALAVHLAFTTATIEGKVDPDQMTKGRTGVVLKDVRSEWAAVAYPDSSGHFKFSGLAPGSYRILAWADLTRAEYLDPAEYVRRKNLTHECTVDNDSHITDVELSLVPLGS